MREITEHQIGAVNEQLRIVVVDPPDNAGSNNEYHIVGPNGVKLEMVFQHGGVPEVGVNGITVEALLAIIADKLHGYQSGPFACRQNEMALMMTEQAAMWLRDRTRSRIKRGVEGTHAV